jgi:hypothetical protein
LRLHFSCQKFILPFQQSGQCFEGFGLSVNLNLSAAAARKVPGLAFWRRKFMVMNELDSMSEDIVSPSAALVFAATTVIRKSPKMPYSSQIAKGMRRAWLRLTTPSGQMHSELQISTLSCTLRCHCGVGFWLLSVPGWFGYKLK